MSNHVASSSQGLKKFHSSVLLSESMELLRIQSGGSYIDCTLGEGGHSIEIYNALGESGKLVSIDLDENAIEFVKSSFADQFDANSDKKSWEIRQGSFSYVMRKLAGEGKKFDGILMDLGISSRQLETRDRGFSYQNESELLDMRMDQSNGVPARDLLKVLNEYELTRLLRVYGEESKAAFIAKKIKQSKKPIETVGELNMVISGAMPAALRHGPKHPARRVYQALRIAVNDELNSLKDALELAPSLLNTGGRLVVISFHSLEDRIVKNFMNDMVTQEKGKLVTKKAILPSKEELERNSRAHSAKIRALEMN